MVAIQGSFLNTLLDKHEDLDPGIILVNNESATKLHLQEWDKSEYFSLDIETYGSGKGDGLNPWSGEIRLIQIGLPSGKTLIADLGGWQERFDLPEEFTTRLKKHLFGKKLVIGANLKFDLLWLKVKFGFDGRNCKDVMLMSQVLWAGLPIQHSLKAIVERLKLNPLDKTEQTSEWGFELTNQQLNYAAKDAQIVFKVYEKLNEFLHKKNLQGSSGFECHALPAFVDMEYYGMPVSIDKLQELIKIYSDLSNEFIQPFKDKYPDVNPDSPQQVTSALQSSGLEISASGQDDLSPYWDIPEIKALSLWRTTTTILDYLKGCDLAYFDGGVRGVYRQINPSGFGRSTCGSDKRAGRIGVNLQNPPNRLPKEIESKGLPHPRTIFTAPDGYTMLVADLSSAHARIAAQVSRDATMLAIYNSGKDLHSVTASGLAKIKGLDWDDKHINKARKDKENPDNKQASLFRTVAKPVFFGSLNSQGAATLKKTIQTDAGMDLPLEDCKQAIQGWRNTYKDLYNFQKQHHNISNKTSHTFPWCDGDFASVYGASGRRVFMQKRVSDFKPNEPAQIKISDCCSFVWTSCEADIIKGAMAAFIARCDEFPQWDATIRNMCHDEVDVVCKSEYAIDVASCLQACMRASMAMFIKSIPPDDLSSKPESLLVKSWADK